MNEMILIIMGAAIGAVIFVLILALLQPRRKCPECGAYLPKFRKPQSKEQALRGGTTCLNCGCEVDRKGEKLTP